MDNFEIRAVIKYLQKKHLSPTEIHADLQNTLGESSPSYEVVKRWCREFKCGRESCEDAPRAGRPTTVTTQENVNKIHDMVMADRRLTIRHIRETTGLAYGTVQSILSNELEMSKVSARWVPRMLTIDQKRTRVTDSERLLLQYHLDPVDFWHGSSPWTKPGFIISILSPNVSLSSGSISVPLHPGNFELVHQRGRLWHQFSGMPREFC